MNMMGGSAAWALCCLIRGYQRAASRLLPRVCRFHPSCSQYALEALGRKPLAVAAWLIARRLVKCQPLHPGGYDPVP